MSSQEEQSPGHNEVDSRTNLEMMAVSRLAFGDPATGLQRPVNNQWRVCFRKEEENDYDLALITIEEFR